MTNPVELMLDKQFQSNVTNKMLKWVLKYFVNTIALM